MITAFRLYYDFEKFRQEKEAQKNASGFWDVFRLFRKSILYDLFRMRMTIL